MSIQFESFSKAELMFVVCGVHALPWIAFHWIFQALDLIILNTANQEQYFTLTDKYWEAGLGLAWWGCSWTRCSSAKVGVRAAESQLMPAAPRYRRARKCWQSRTFCVYLLQKTGPCVPLILKPACSIWHSLCFQIRFISLLPAWGAMEKGPLAGTSN